MAGFWNGVKRIFSRSDEPTDREKRVLPRYGGNLDFFHLSNDNALSIATVYRCVQLIGDSVASLRLQYMRKIGGRYQEDERSPYHYLLTVQPQPEMNAYDFISSAVREMLIEGNAYIFPRRIDGVVTDLVLCHRKSVSHEPLNNTYTICDAYSGVFGTFGEDEIIHLYLHTSDGRTGESVLSHAARLLNIATAGDEETLNRFKNGGTVRGLVTNDKSVMGFGEYQDTELSKTATDIDGRFKSGENIVSLPGQADFKTISLSSTDMQFLESRKFTVRDICRFFGVHPSFVFDDTSSNYKSAEMANVAFLSNTLNPILLRIENEFNRKLVSRANCCREIFKFDRRGIYSLDLTSLAAYQKATIESGIYTINDWRRIENQPIVEGGDAVMVSANIKSLDSWMDDQLSGIQIEIPKETNDETEKNDNKRSQRSASTRGRRRREQPDNRRLCP